MSVQTHSSVSPLVALDVVVAYGDRGVLDGVDLLAQPGRPLGLVGENGAGKSTLLRVLSRAEEPGHGSIAVPADLAYLPQEPSFPHRATVGRVLDAALAPLHEKVQRLEDLAARLDEPGVPEEYAALLDWATLHDAWDADHRSDRAAARLGLDAVDRSRPNVCGTVVDLDPAHLGVDGHGGNRFTGGYSDYLRAKQDARRRWEEAFLAQQEELTALRAAAATTARMATKDRSALGRAELGLLHPRDAARPVGVLSVGQQRRLALAILVARQPDLLLLDEPTNHISLSLADELEDALHLQLLPAS